MMLILDNIHHNHANSFDIVYFDTQLVLFFQYALRIRFLPIVFVLIKFRIAQSIANQLENLIDS